MPRSQSSETERERRRTADRQRLGRGVTELQSSDGWRAWVRVRSRNGLARYSLHNQLLIALQRPDASYVAGFKAFLALNRCVRKGERAIRILAPITPANQINERLKAGARTWGARAIRLSPGDSASALTAELSSHGHPASAGSHREVHS
jgi:hypothetical protein